jgi:hypothetical protein
MKALWITTLALASIGRVVAQDVPPPPPMRGDAASLKDTLKFIQDKLPGKVNYIVYPHDNVAGTDPPPAKRSFELSNVSADASRCYIGFHSRFDNGKNTNNIVDKDSEIFLKQVREIVLMQMDQEVQQATAKAGHPELSFKVDPPVFLVVVKSEHHSMMFNFYDGTLSDRVSKALQHAVELCGGGNPEPF